MKGNPIDDLFRKKLSHQKMAPPPAAWGAIEQNLPGKKKKGAYFWLSIAASVAVIFTAGWLVIASQGETTGQMTAQNTKDQAPTQEEVDTNTPTEQPTETLVAENREEESVIKETPTAPARTQVKAVTNKPQFEESIDLITHDEEVLTDLVADTEVRRAIISIKPLQINDHLNVDREAIELNYDMVMPLDLSAYYILKTEDIELAPKKRKFRVLNGIISIAKEVNNGKLSFSELRNAKNNFVEGDLKYGTKEIDSGDDEEPDEPGKE